MSDFTWQLHPQLRWSSTWIEEQITWCSPWGHLASTSITSTCLSTTWVGWHVWASKLQPPLHLFTGTVSGTMCITSSTDTPSFEMLDSGRSWRRSSIVVLVEQLTAEEMIRRWFSDAHSNPWIPFNRRTRNSRQCKSSVTARRSLLHLFFHCLPIISQKGKPPSQLPKGASVSFANLQGTPSTCARLNCLSSPTFSLVPLKMTSSLKLESFLPVCLTDKVFDNYFNFPLNIHPNSKQAPEAQHKKFRSK